METIGGRLRFERERLALSQPVLAEMCGVTMRSQRNYEKDERLPDAGYLAAATRSGVDVVYVLTGERLPGTPALTPEESALLDNFRHSPPAARKAIKATERSARATRKTWRRGRMRLIHNDGMPGRSGRYGCSLWSCSARNEHNSRKGGAWQTTRSSSRIRARARCVRPRLAYRGQRCCSDRFPCSFEGVGNGL